MVGQAPTPFESALLIGYGVTAGSIDSLKAERVQSEVSVRDLRRWGRRPIWVRDAYPTRLRFALKTSAQIPELAQDRHGAWCNRRRQRITLRPSLG